MNRSVNAALAGLGSLRLDCLFGWRQLARKKVASAAAILSLALAIGACTSAFRLIDALLLRPLPVAAPDRLYAVAFEGTGMDGKRLSYDSSSYPMYRRMADAVRNEADTIAVSYGDRVDLTYGSDLAMERAWLQYVSGSLFPAFELRPAAGRLLSAADDLTPGAQPVAVLSYDYWSRRFGRDPHVVGRTFHLDGRIFEIVGVAAPPFTGTETGLMTEIFVPMMMKNPATLASSHNYWLRTLVELKPGAAPQPVGEKLRAVFRQIQEEQALASPMPHLPGIIPPNDKMLFEPAPSGRSNLQRDYRLALGAIAVLVALVLLIACANVANLKMAQTAARAREMALRISLGAGRWRLVRMVLIESVWLALIAAAVGAAFAWWSAPFLIARINSPENPARLELLADWRVLSFGLLLALAVALLFGLAPAWRASSIQPVEALKGGSAPPARRRFLHALIALQCAFCLMVNFVAGLFVTSFDRLSRQPTGFSADRILNLEAASLHPLPASAWNQVAGRLRASPGVEGAAITIWPMMSGESRVSPVAFNGGPPFPMLCDILNVTPGWFDLMRIPLLDGRDFRPEDSSPRTAIVNRAFARQYLQGEDPVGKSFEMLAGNRRISVAIAGLVADARSRDNIRFPIRPTAYFPFQAVDADGTPVPARRGTFVVRTAARNPLALASSLRLELPRAQPEIHASNIRTQTEIEESHTVREHMLAMLGLFFAATALALAGVGLHGVLDYSVQLRRREIGIRMAIGAPAGKIARGVTADVFVMVAVGGAAGLIGGLASSRYIESLLFAVRATDLARLAFPSAAILLAAILAAVPGVIRAVRTDPARVLRAD
ncbi:MAG TPA: ADOP family duplicated permease [Bryobacteraceae bacterium]|nr:ADOP family duplicated permease [Bryobacteraceae bacterium]